MKQIFLLLVLAFLGSCAPGLRNGNGQVVRFADIEPLVQNYVEPSFNSKAFHTFTVARIAGTEFAPNRNGLEESQLLNSVIAQLTQRGYRYDDTGEKADFAVYINYQNSFQTSYVPPETVTVPRWVPGQTVTSQTDANVYYGGQYGYGSATQQTFIPGYMTTDTYTSSGYTTGNFYPSVALDFFDMNTGQTIYSGRAVWTSDIADIRVAFPWVANYALRDVPDAVKPNTCKVTSTRTSGVKTIVGTLDGNTYYPLVSGFSEEHPVRYLGREKLQVYDALVSVSGKSLQNLIDTCQQQAAFARPNDPSPVRTLQVYREGELLEIPIELY